MKIKVYSTPVCPYCIALKNWLSENNIEFEEIDISQDERLQKKIIQKTGKMEVPVIEIDGQIVVGFEKEKIAKILKIK